MPLQTEKSRNSLKTPCLQGNPTGDRFAPDWLHSQPVACTRTASAPSAFLGFSFNFRHLRISPESSCEPRQLRFGSSRPVTPAFLGAQTGVPDQHRCGNVFGSQATGKPRRIARTCRHERPTRWGGLAPIVLVIRSRRSAHHEPGALAKPVLVLDDQVLQVRLKSSAYCFFLIIVARWYPQDSKLQDQAGQLGQDECHAR